MQRGELVAATHHSSKQSASALFVAASKRIVRSGEVIAKVWEEYVLTEGKLKNPVGHPQIENKCPDLPRRLYELKEVQNLYWRDVVPMLNQEF